MTWKMCQPKTILSWYILFNSISSCSRFRNKSMLIQNDLYQSVTQCSSSGIGSLYVFPCVNQKIIIYYILFNSISSCSHFINKNNLIENDLYQSATQGSSSCIWNLLLARVAEVGHKPTDFFIIGRF